MKATALLPRPRRLATRLVVPFVLLVLFLAVVGTWYFTRQAVGSLQERRLAQLADALRREQVVVTDAEAASLDVVRRVASSPAVADAITSGDPAATTAAVGAAARAGSTAGVAHVSVVVVTPAGAGTSAVVDMRPRSGPTAGAAVGAQLASFPGIDRVLAGSPGATDDKDAALVPATDALPAALVVAGPIRSTADDGAEHVSGAVVVSTPLSDLVEASRVQLGMDNAIVGPGGVVLASTFGGEGGPFRAAGDLDVGTEDGRRLASSVDWGGGDYTVAAGPLALHGLDAGLVAAALPDAPVAKSIDATRTQVLLLFAGGLLGVLLIGLGVSRRLSRDIADIAGAADAVAAGDFERRVEQRSRDELGRLAGGFNEMAGRLGEYRAEQEGVITALREADRAKDEFIDNLSHELRTPLTPIKGSARLLARDDLDAATRRQMAALIATNSDRLLEQVNRLIAMSTRAQRGDPRREPVDLAALAADVVASRVAVELRDRVRISGALGSIPYANADPAAASQVLYDLLDNALKFSDAAVDVGFDAGDGWVAVEVADRGPGIPEIERGRVFERFYQVDGSSTRRHGGLGLGLAVASDLALWLGGGVELAGRTGGGTRAVFRLPPVPSTPDAVDRVEPGLFGLAVQRVPTQSR